MTLVDARVPVRAPGLELLGELQDSGYHEAPSVVRRSDGQLVQLTALLYQLLDAIDGRRDIDDLAQELSRRCGKACEPDDVAYLIEQKLAPLGLLAGADGAAPQTRPPIPLLALRWKFVISDPAVTQRITAPFAFLFRRAIVVPVLLAFAATTYWVLFHEGLAAGTRQAFDSPGLLLAAFALMVVSAGWHEFGHAAACQAAGARPGAMGAGLYMVWPAFYTDVDDCRRLDRRGRLMVDLGGLYFNAVAAVALAAVWAVARVDALLLVVAAQLILMVRQLAPIIRADGYHILSDLVGVPDLFQHLRPTLLGMLPTHWGRPQPLRPYARWVVRAWAILVVPLLAWLFVLAVLLLPRLVATAWVGLRRELGAITQAFGEGDVLTVTASLLEIVSLVLPVAAGTYLLVRVVRRVAGKAWTATDGRPLARTALATGLAVALALLAVAWWPTGQYEPVHAGERGTLADTFEMVQARATTPAAADGATPVTGYALTPRDGEGETLLLVRDDDGGLRAIATADGENGVAFPFELPEPPRAGDNQALAVNTEDGTVVYEVAVALVWVTEGGVADHRNEAYALASCANCTTVAVAFQVVFVVGETDAVAPVNVAVAANGGCVSCQTAALAVQLVVTLEEMPTDEVRAEIEAVFGRLENLDEAADPYAEIKAVEQELLTLVESTGLVETTSTTEERDVERSTTTSTPERSSTTSTTTRSTTTSTTERSTTTTSTTERTTTTTTEQTSSTTAQTSSTTGS